MLSILYEATYHAAVTLPPTVSRTISLAQALDITQPRVNCRKINKALIIAGASLIIRRHSAPINLGKLLWYLVEMVCNTYQHIFIPRV